MLTTVILSASGENRLDLYFSIYLIECLILTLLFGYFNPKARRGLNVIGYVLFIGFMFIVAVKVVEILVGVKLL